MLPQYKMVLINVLLSAILILCLGIYKYIFKRKINLLYLLILISILPIISIFRAGSYESGDLSLHIQRTMSFHNLLFNYHLIPRWTPEFNAGYGDPHFLFSYFLPYFIGSVFHFVGFSFLNSVKILIALSFVTSGVTMYLWAKKELGKIPGFVSAIFYLFMPYHLVDLHFRVTIAENLSYTFLPLILLAIKNFVEKNNRLWFIILSISFGLLILSHQAISIMFLPIMIAYSIFVWFRKNNKNLKELFFCLISMSLGLLITSFYWMPIIFLAKFTQQGLYTPPISFPMVTELLYSPWRFGLLFQGHYGELSYLIGYTQLSVVIFSIYLFCKKGFNKNLKNLFFFFLIIFIIILFMITSLSKPIWEITPLLKYSQYSTRFLVILSLSISLIAGIVVKKINKNWFIFGLCFVTIFYTILNWGNRRTIPIVNDEFLRNDFKIRPDLGPALEPTSPIWVSQKNDYIRTIPKNHMEILSGNAFVKENYRSPIIHTYTVNAKTQVEIKENTLFFPGWIVLANNKQVSINYVNQKFPGVITFKLDEGIYDIEVKLIELPIIIFSKWLSGLSFIGLLAYFFIPKKSDRPKL